MLIGFIVAFFVFYPFKRTNIWPTKIQICFITFVIQQNNNQRSNYYCSMLFQKQIDIYKKWFKTLLSNFICFIINHWFYVIILWMHYTLFISVSRRDKANCYGQLYFCVSDFLKLLIVTFKYSSSSAGNSLIAGVFFLS